MFNIAGFLEVFLINSNANIIANIFLFLIIGFFALALYYTKSGVAHTFTAYTPTLLTSLGILGTFIGVVIGLLHFDPSNIDGSIELLLGGLKTAFITSLAGMFGAIAYKLIEASPYFEPVKPLNFSNVTATPEDILNVMVQQNEHLSELRKAISGEEESSLAGQVKLLRSDANDNFKAEQTKFDGVMSQQNEHLSELRKSIAGEEESSLAGQMKLLRSDTSDNFKVEQTRFDNFSQELWTNLHDFSEKLSKSATEQVIEALNQVIKDFNKNLTEQFGDNFKALDASVQKLVTWQDQYSQQLTQMTAQYSQGVKAITDIETSVANINNETKVIPDSMKALNSVMLVNQHQIKELGAHLTAFKTIKDEAVSAFPEIQKHVQKTVEEITKSSQKASAGYELLLTNTESIQKSFSESASTMQTQFDATVKNIIEKQVSELQRYSTALEDEVKKSVELTGTAVNKEVEMLNQTTSKEVNRIMNEMGKALTSITGQFTNDYSQLVTAMKAVTNR